MELSKSFADAVESAGRTVVAVHEGGRSGVSGTLWRENIAVTAAHTIAGLKSVTLTLPDGSSGAANVAGVLPRLDVALLKLEKPFGAAVQTAGRQSLRVGEIVLALGRRGANGIVATHGIISGIPAENKPLRLDLQPFTGFSGGPLVNSEGRLIGINTSGPRREVVTIPAASIERAIATLLSKGRIPSPYLGVGLQPVRVSEGREATSSRHALLVVMVEPGGPAHKAGLVVGDIVTTVEGSTLIRTSDLERALDPEKVGQAVRVGILRGGHAQDVNITVGDRDQR
jgi:S1-C subfamily serine protease